MTPEQQAREAFEEAYLRADMDQAFLEQLRDTHEAALDRLVAEREGYKRDFLAASERAAMAEGREAALRGAVRFALEAAEEVLELEEPPAEIADVATSAARAIAECCHAALAAVPAADPTPPEET